MTTNYAPLSCRYYATQRTSNDQQNNRRLDQGEEEQMKERSLDEIFGREGADYDKQFKMKRLQHKEDFMEKVADIGGRHQTRP